jgi:hypothetical protein
MIEAGGGNWMEAGKKIYFALCQQENTHLNTQIICIRNPAHI